MQTLSTKDLNIVNGGLAAPPCSWAAFGTAAGEGAFMGIFGGMFTGQLEAIPGAMVGGAVGGLIWQGFQCVKTLQ